MGIEDERSGEQAVDLNGRVVLVTGGTGSFGRKFTEIVLRTYAPHKLIIFSRDELKQYEMQKQFNSPALRFFVCDVLDLCLID